MSRLSEAYVRAHGVYPQAPGFKEQGGTSEQAARTVSNADTVRAAVLAAITAAPSTADEVATALGLSVLTVRPRVSELRTLGSIEKTNDRRHNASGKAATVWRARRG